MRPRDLIVALKEDFMEQIAFQHRETFAEWLRGRATGEYAGKLTDIITTQDGHYDLKLVITQLWDCNVAMSDESCAKAHVPAGSSYGYAVRAERQWLDRRR